MLVGVIGQTMILSELTEVTSFSSPGQQFDQCAIRHDGLLHLFWASISIDAAWGQDSDILHATFDGEEWSEPEILTPDDNGNDYTPYPIVFDGELYIFWQTDEFTLTGGNYSDIVYRVHDGSGWGPANDVTKGLNDNDEYNPSALVFDGQLHLFFEWFSSESITEEIGVTIFDGAAWGGMTNITEASDGLNVNPKAAALQNEIILVWETYDTSYAGSEGGSENNSADGHRPECSLRGDGEHGLECRFGIRSVRPLVGKDRGSSKRNVLVLPGSGPDICPVARLGRHAGCYMPG